MSTVQIKINTVDKSSLIAWESVSKVEVLTKEPDTLTFAIRNYPSKTYIPSLNDTVQMYDNGTLIFAGSVTSIDNKIDGLLTTTTIIAQDWTNLADGKAVAKTYTSQTGTQIVQDIFTNYASGFTTVNVNCPVVLDKITFNYVTVVQALQKLIQAIGGGYDWYIDYSKDVHFFQTGAVVAPFSLSDTNGNFNYQSLTMTTDLSQLRNQVIVRGGNIAGSTATNSQVANGVQSIFFVGYNLAPFTAYMALAASPTSFSTLNVGNDGTDNPASFDALYNPNVGLLKFPSAVAINNVIKVTGTPSFPIISLVQNDASIALYGVKQYVIVDRTVLSRLNAIGKAQAELYQYSNPLVTGSFRTQVSGLKAGQVIAINCPKRGINGVYKIEQITTTLKTPSATTSDFYFDVNFVSTVGLNLIDVLNRLLVVDPSTQIQVGSNEIVDTVSAFNDTVTATDSVNTSLVHNPITETVTATESFTNNGLNFGTIFVAGDFTPSGTSRVFCLDSSPLG